MTTPLNICKSESNGSQFFRGDLHIHTYPSSHDVKDISMTPQSVINTALSENLHIIAVADHNEISNVDETIKLGKQSDILVIPAVELSAPEGHLLCYFPTFDSLNRFHAQLKLEDRGLSNSRCLTSMFSCLELVASLGGFCILAHIDGGNGLESNRPGGSPHKQDILCHPALLGIELTSFSSEVSYTPYDPDQTRQTIGAERIKKLQLGEKQYLARILNSDSHTINALGRNASQNKKLTRYKMTEPSFSSLRHALEENDSRVRLEDEIPTSTPFILGASLYGGFLENQVFHFNRNLNCIIGGRGTGKSTTFEAVRCLTGQASDAEVIDSEVWPQQLYLFWQDEAGQQHTLSRPLGQNLLNLDDEINGPKAFNIDCFSQGEAAKVREQFRHDPLALMKYLDTFTNVNSSLDAELASIIVLKEKYSEIVQAEEHVAKIPDTQRSLEVVKQQIKAFESANGAEIIKLQRGLAIEKSKRQSLEIKLLELKTIVNSDSLNNKTKELKNLVSGDDFVVGKESASKINGSLELFINVESAAQQSIVNAYSQLETSLKESLQEWTVKEKPILEQIELKRSELEAQGIKLDMVHMSQITTNEANLQQNLTNLKTWEPHLIQLKKTYKEAFAERIKQRHEVAKLRQAYGFKATKALAEVLTDLQVKLKYIEAGSSEEGVKIISQAMGWRTSSVPKAKAIISNMGITTLIQCLYSNETKPILDIKTEENISIFNKSEAENIISVLSTPAIRASLESCHFDDLPQLIVSKRLNQSGETKFQSREFFKLSLGQQQSVLLALILSSDSCRPLIIDQPEDNLDSEFIFHTFVPVLRRAKERRQVIIITHNANIAVLGDAEQLIVLKSSSNKSQIIAKGSIDDTGARDNACRILEGAKEAFTRRARIYGIR